MPEQTVKYHVFKSHNPVASVPIGDGKFLAFQNGEGYLEDSPRNEKAVAKVKNWIDNYPEMGLYQVPGKETMELPVNEMARNRPKRELNQFLANQAAASRFQGDDKPAQYLMQATASSDSPTTGGKSAPAPRFAQVDGDAAEKLRLAALNGGLGQATQKVVQTQVPQQSVAATDEVVDKLVDPLVQSEITAQTEGTPASVRTKLEAMQQRRLADAKAEAEKKAASAPATPAQ